MSLQLTLPDRTVSRQQLPQLQSPLLKLPAELRNIIYEYSLISDEPIIEPLPPGDRPAWRSDAYHLPALGAALVATCKSINSELDIRPLYTNNTFAVTSPQRANLFFRSLPNKHKDLLTRISVDLQHCIDDETRETDTNAELAWYEYLACPTMHFRTRNNHVCTLSVCSHLFFDLPHVKHVTIDVRAALAKALSFSEVNRMLSFFLRGSCAGSTDISTSETCRPDLTVSLLPGGAQRVYNCWSCRNGAAGEPWDPAWLCNGQKAETCRQMYDGLGQGESTQSEVLRALSEMSLEVS